MPREWLAHWDLIDRTLVAPCVVVHVSEFQLVGMHAALVHRRLSASEVRDLVDAYRGDVLAQGGTVVADLDADQGPPTPLIHPHGGSDDDATVLSAAIATRSTFLVTADHEFLDVATVMVVRAGQVWILPSSHPGHLLVGLHAFAFAEAMQTRGGWSSTPEIQHLTGGSPGPRLRRQSAIAMATAQVRAARLAAEADAVAAARDWRPPARSRGPAGRSIPD